MKYSQVLRQLLDDHKVRNMSKKDLFLILFKDCQIVLWGYKDFGMDPTVTVPCSHSDKHYKIFSSKG